MTSPQKVEARLYVARDCRLCEELRDQLEELTEELPLQIEEIDITGVPELEAEFRAEIPVLFLNGRKAVKYRISTEALRQRVRRAAGQRGLGTWFLR